MVAAFSFNKHRIIALLIFTVASCMAWYGTILITNDVEASPYPDRYQFLGLGIVIVVEVLLWIQSCLTIKPNISSKIP